MPQNTLFWLLLFKTHFTALQALRTRPNRTDEKLYIKWCEKKIQEKCKKKVFHSKNCTENLYKKYTHTDSVALRGTGYTLAYTSWGIFNLWYVVHIIFEMNFTFFLYIKIHNRANEKSNATREKQIKNWPVWIWTFCVQFCWVFF